MKGVLAAVSALCLCALSIGCQDHRALSEPSARPASARIQDWLNTSRKNVQQWLGTSRQDLHLWSQEVFLDSAKVGSLFLIQ